LTGPYIIAHTEVHSVRDAEEFQKIETLNAEVKKGKVNLKITVNDNDPAKPVEITSDAVELNCMFHAALKA
jgi:hypothetical protein